MKLLLAFLSLVLTSSLYAADSSSGCGLGWSIAPKTSLVSSYTRTLVNVTASNTIAMTLGTSGCAKHSIVYNEKQGVHFVEANRNELAIELARGQGEFVTGLAAVFGCQNAKAFGSMIQGKYESVLPNANVSGVELYNNIRNEIKNNQTLSVNCSLI